MKRRIVSAVLILVSLLSVSCKSQEITGLNGKELQKSQYKSFICDTELNETEIDLKVDYWREPVKFKNLESKHFCFEGKNYELVYQSSTTEPYSPFEEDEYHDGDKSYFSFKSGTEENIRPLECNNYSPSMPKAKTATANYEAILVPQTFDSGKLKVTFKIGKGNYEWTNTSAITLEAGKTYNLPISVTSAPPIETHNGRVYVDMGLSVKWATCNVGATTPFESGDYFDWGETEPYYESLDPLKWKADIHYDYYWDCYKWCNGSVNTMTKYNAEDKQTTLEPGDDAATANWGGSWRTPTNEEWDMLRKFSIMIWKTTTEGYAHDGLLITSIINGYSIFLPAAGYFEYQNISSSDKLKYWSSILYEVGSNYGNSIHFSTGLLFFSNLQDPRCNGLPVRPVCP